MDAAALKPWHTERARLALLGRPAELIDDDAGRPMLVLTHGAETRAIVDLAEARALVERLSAGHGV